MSDATGAADAPPRNHLDPRVLAGVKGLELRARLVVEGYMAGRHRSPDRGVSVEFAQHRQYAAGDELRRLDWKVYARSDKLYLKEYEVETNMPVWVAVDRSESMAYASPGSMSKYDYACCIGATLAYLALQQQDAVGYVSFDAGVRNLVKPATSPAHLRAVLHDMEAARCDAKKTGLGETLSDLAERLGRKGLVILVSDLLDDRDRILAGLRRLHHRRHEIIVFHVLDRWERTFPFDESTMFEGLEGYDPVLVDAKALREQYLREVQDFTATLARECRSRRIDFVPMDTSQSLEVPLSVFLAARAARR